tara:strand:- start:4 stop:537 length:534 start_codon:yes stop_codon:yes gene_type:complete
MKILDLGCGIDKYKAKTATVIGIDQVDVPGVDVKHDLDKFPYPFKEDEFDMVYCSHILEHVKDLTKTLKELQRITKPNGIIKIRVPHFSCGVTYRDPTHVRFFSYFTFDYYSDKCFYAPIKFVVKKQSFNFTRTAMTWLNGWLNPLLNAFPTMYERFFCWILPTSEVLFELENIKSR